MRGLVFAECFLAVAIVGVRPACADRPDEKREKADCVVTGTVTRVYKSESEGYNEYIVEAKVESAEKGKDNKPGDTFRAFCYQIKPGKGGGLEFDSSGHNTVPKAGERVKMYVISGRGTYEGTYPDWVDVLPAKKKGKSK